MTAELNGFAQATTKTLERLSEPKVHTVEDIEVWKPKDHDEEIAGWPEWSFLFKSFMGMLDRENDSALDLLEKISPRNKTWMTVMMTWSRGREGYTRTWCLT